MSFKQNMGTIDRLLRVLLALVIAVLYFSSAISGTVALILGIVAAVFLVTGFTGFCPLYQLFNLSTRKA
jgi:hypothetical protein